MLELFRTLVTDYSIILKMFLNSYKYCRLISFIKIVIHFEIGSKRDAVMPLKTHIVWHVSIATLNVTVEKREHPVLDGPKQPI